jgi:hypothetical protein
LASKKEPIYKSILVISDMHVPYHHPDTVKFLAAVKAKHKPDKVVCIGDEIDFHSISFHEKNPDLMSPGDELAACIRELKPIYKLFPEVNLIDSNHGSLVFRKTKWAGLPKSVIRPMSAILQTPSTWTWSFDLTLKTPLGPVYFHHGKSSVSGGLAKNMGMNSVQGHFHTKFQIEYLANPERLFWDMHVGCLADDKSMAMSYNKTTLARPIVGVGLIKNGKPELCPMVLEKGGKWIGEV